MERVAAAADRIEDPIERAKAIEDASRLVPDLQHSLRVERADAIREALETRTATSVAAELGISRSRLYKVLED